MLQILDQTPENCSTGDRPAESVGFEDLFKIGIGPSSSHTVGPMKAALSFRNTLVALSEHIESVLVTVFGSLAWTGRGHATDKALILGLAGHSPESVNPEDVEDLVAAIASGAGLLLSGGQNISFVPQRDIVFDRERTFQHSNAMIFEAFGVNGAPLVRELWFSIGGGFVVKDGDTRRGASLKPYLYPYTSAEELLDRGRQAALPLHAMVLANECMSRPRQQVLANIDRVADVMMGCIDRGLSNAGELGGGLKVKRRAKEIHDRLRSNGASGKRSPAQVMEYVSVYAMAVNEENAAGGRVVTAPTNGAAGVIPAVLRYYTEFCPQATRDGLHTFFLTATAIGAIVKRNSSISGADVGCQGEVGTAAAMAAAGLAAALGGSNEQVENAAEIAMEHHLGLTCDPVAGLVQIPCIERNAFGAVKAINAAHLALLGDGMHRVSLDQVIETMRQTGFDMQSKYKETSQGGLAVNVPEC